MVYLIWKLRPRVTGTAEDSVALARDFAEQKDRLGTVKCGELYTAFALGSAIFLWLAPGIGELFGAQSGVFRKGYVNDDMVGLCAGLALFVAPIDLRRGEFALSWREGAKIDWGTVMLAAGGLSLGALIFSTGLANATGNGIAAVLQSSSPSLIIAVGVLLSVILSEIASNTAAANVTVPLMIAVATSAGIDPVPVALACAFACTFGFMLPVSSGPNTLAYATGEVRIRGMMRHGIALDLIGIAVIWLTVTLLAPLLNVMPKSL
jgi:sodium-dependent dicarboxylate transporter 2/3/5